MQYVAIYVVPHEDIHLVRIEAPDVEQAWIFAGNMTEIIRSLRHWDARAGLLSLVRWTGKSIGKGWSAGLLLPGWWTGPIPKPVHVHQQLKERT